MEYRGTIYRPPLEANTFLLPVTEGCTHNRCRFCNMYKDTPFRMLPLDQVEGALRETRERYPGYCDRLKRVYLVGADPFVLSAKNLEERIGVVRKYLPNVRTVTMYARVTNIMGKHDEELLRLKELGVDDLYVGVECGLSGVLDSLGKGSSADDAKEQCLRLNRAGIHHRDLLMLGTGGKGRGAECALATARLENEIKPDMILVHAMSAFVGTELEKDIQEGRFLPAGEREILMEERTLLENLDLPDTYFWGAHSLNSVMVDGLIGEEREEMLATLAHGIEHVDEAAINRTSRRGTL